MTENESEIESVRRSFLRLRTNLVVVSISLVLIAAGAFIVLAASEWQLASVGAAVGTSLLAVGALALVSELTTRRTVLRETFAMVNLRDELRLAGMTALHSSRDVLDRTFPELVGKARKVDLMFVSAATWVSSNQEQLKRMLHHGGRVRLLIPDPSDDELLIQLLTRFEYPSLEGLRTDVQHTLNLAMGIAGAYPERTGTLPARLGGVRKGFAIRRLTVVPTYSFYRVDDLGVMRVHEVRKEKASKTPVLVFGRGGDSSQLHARRLSRTFRECETVEQP